MTGLSILRSICPYFLANLIAASFASAPLLQKNTLLAKLCEVNHLAKSSCSGIQ